MLIAQDPLAFRQLRVTAENVHSGAVAYPAEEVGRVTSEHPDIERKPSLIEQDSGFYNYLTVFYDAAARLLSHAP